MLGGNSTGCAGCRILRLVGSIDLCVPVLFDSLLAAVRAATVSVLVLCFCVPWANLFQLLRVLREATSTTLQLYSSSLLKLLINCLSLVLSTMALGAGLKFMPRLGSLIISPVSGSVTVLDLFLIWLMI